MGKFLRVFISAMAVINPYIQWQVESDGVQEVEIVFGDRTEKEKLSN